MLGFTSKGMVGALLLVLGTIAFFPTVGTGAGMTSYTVAVVATALVTVGTYLVGTDVEGRPA